MLQKCSNEGNNVGLVVFAKQLAKRDIDLDKLEKVDLELQLETLRSDWEYINSLEATEKGDKAEMLAEIKAKGEEVKLALANLPEYISIAKADIEEPNFLRSSLLIMVNDFADFLNIGKNISEAQTELLVELLAEEAKGLTLEDVVKLFYQAKKGDFGQLFDRLDGAIILGWLKQYKETRRLRNMARQQNKGGANRSSKHRINEHHHLGKPLEMKGLAGLTRMLDK